jgi:hypothetical protein
MCTELRLKMGGSEGSENTIILAGLITSILTGRGISWLDAAVSVHQVSYYGHLEIENWLSTIKECCTPAPFTNIQRKEKSISIRAAPSPTSCGHHFYVDVYLRDHRQPKN